jgi:hypothetical protein
VYTEPRYAYVGGSPAYFNDPTGLMAIEAKVFCVLLAGFGVGVGMATWASGMMIMSMNDGVFANILGTTNSVGGVTLSSIMGNVGVACMMK